MLQNFSVAKAELRARVSRPKTSSSPPVSFIAGRPKDEILNLIESVSEDFLFYSCYFCESSYLFYLSFNFDFCVSKIMHL